MLEFCDDSLIFVRKAAAGGLVDASCDVLRLTGQLLARLEWESF